jgi:hypothetical protein
VRLERLILRQSEDALDNTGAADVRAISEDPDEPLYVSPFTREEMKGIIARCEFAEEECDDERMKRDWRYLRDASYVIYDDMSPGINRISQ